MLVDFLSFCFPLISSRAYVSALRVRESEYAGISISYSIGEGQMKIRRIKLTVSVKPSILHFLLG